MVHATAGLALEQLADELGSAAYATILTGGQVPTLRVVNRQAPRLAEDIHAGDGWFRGAVAGPIAPCADIPAAARAIARALDGQAR
jgi:hypothetical protein